jgi:hypothetical protein
MAASSRRILPGFPACDGQQSQYNRIKRKIPQKIQGKKPKLLLVIPDKS